MQLFYVPMVRKDFVYDVLSISCITLSFLAKTAIWAKSEIFSYKNTLGLGPR